MAKHLGSIQIVAKLGRIEELPQYKILKMADNYETYKLGDFKLKNGREISGAFIAYKTFGDPSLPAIIYPSWYSGCKLLLF